MSVNTEYNFQPALNNILNSLDLDFLKNPTNWNTIPLVNYTPLHCIKDKSIVRFRGMIQDMLDPEIYLERYKVVADNGKTERLQDGKYQDCLKLGKDEQIDFSSSANIHGERRTLFVVSIPGLNEWACTYEKLCNQPNVPKMQIQRTADENSSIRLKRLTFENENTAESDVQQKFVNDNVQNMGSKKRLCTEKTQTDENKKCSLSLDYLVNAPIRERPSMACMVKIYEDFDAYLLNSIIDVVGFISVDPMLDGSTLDVDSCDDFTNLLEMQAHNPPPSLIPRLHAISVHIVPHSNPLLDDRFLHLEQRYCENINMFSVRKDLHKLLALCLFNDDLAADYLLSHLISTVYTRTDMHCIGKFTLNIYHLPQNLINYTEKLYEIIELLLPTSHYLPMTLENMNTTDFVPRKDYETNKLVSGILQLTPHTHLVLDETKMEQGKLEANGVSGIQSLSYLINQQQIKYNFQFYDINYNTYIPVLILSEGKSMLPNDFAIPLNPDSDSVNIITETFKAAQHYLQQQNRLNIFRSFLTKSRLCKFSMNTASSEMIQSDFVNMRKNNVISSADDLHSLLVLSRLLGISQGKVEFDIECWEIAKTMEANRQKRIATITKFNK